MLYFIPAWYRQNEWCENEQSWHTRRMHSEFDETVKQIQLFHRSGVYPYQIMLLSFAPNFRHFLHRQGVYHASYWSCFDAIQQIRRKKAHVLSFHNIDWPKGIEFVYSQFVVLAFLKGKKYAKIEFGEDGNPIQVDMYEDNMLCRRNIYDDRGFLSCTVLYRNEKPIYQEFLMRDGNWKLRRFYEDGHVEINPRRQEYLLLCGDKEQTKRFSRLSYGNMQQVIYEVLTSYLQLTADTDIFCAAMHERHAGLLQEALADRRTILSFYENRYLPQEHPEQWKMMKRADFIITDSTENEKRIQNCPGMESKKIAVISPYNVSADSGTSGRIKVQKILVPVDGMKEDVFHELILVLAGYLSRNMNARVHFFTREAEYGRGKKLLERVREELREAGLEEGLAVETDAENISENNLHEEEKITQKFFVEQCVSELDVSTCMRQQRLIVDVRKNPEMFPQIIALSLGIPQIVCTKTEFVESGRNGIILEEIDQLPDALDYYLVGLTHWNEARVYSYELGRNYTTDKLLKTWKEVLDFVG